MYIPTIYLGNKNLRCKDCQTIRFAAGGVPNIAYYVPCGEVEQFTTNLPAGRSVDICITSGSSYALTGGGGSITNLLTSCSCTNDCNCTTRTFSNTSGTSTAIYRNCGSVRYSTIQVTPSSSFTTCVVNGAYIALQGGGSITTGTGCQNCPPTNDCYSIKFQSSITNVATAQFKLCNTSEYRSYPLSPGEGVIICCVSGSESITGTGATITNLGACTAPTCNTITFDTTGGTAGSASYTPCPAYPAPYPVPDNYYTKVSVGIPGGTTLTVCALSGSQSITGGGNIITIGSSCSGSI